MTSPSSPCLSVHTCSPPEPLIRIGYWEASHPCLYIHIVCTVQVYYVSLLCRIYVYTICTPSVFRRESVSPLAVEVSSECSLYGFSTYYRILCWLDTLRYYTHTHISLRPSFCCILRRRNIIPQSRCFSPGFYMHDDGRTSGLGTDGEFSRAEICRLALHCVTAYTSMYILHLSKASSKQIVTDIRHSIQSRHSCIA